MKFFRSITVILILVLSTSPALAANCVTSFALNSVMEVMHSDSKMSGMAHCQDSAMKKDGSQSGGAKHKPCPMGAGCHFTQATPVDIYSKYSFNTSTTQSFAGYTPLEKSVDLSPPLKPPA